MIPFDWSKPITKATNAASLWAIRIDDRELTEKEHKRFRKWLLQSPEHQSEFRIAVGLTSLFKEIAPEIKRERLCPASALQLQTVIDRIEKVPEGHLIEIVMLPWFAIYREIIRNPGFMHQLTPLQLEEMIAGAYKLAGFSHVTITPKSADRGRDVIATSRDGYTVRILDQAKKYAADKVVGYEAIRAFIMVLDADRATRGFLTTTGVFPPNLLRDYLIAPRLGSTLELIDGANLTKRLGELAYGTSAPIDAETLDKASVDDVKLDYSLLSLSSKPARNPYRRLIIGDTFPQTHRFRSQCHNVQSGETVPKPLELNRVTSR